MAIPDSDVTMALALDAVCCSSGFSLDIGGSVTKLVYRSKDEYTGGKPQDETQYKTQMGQVHLAQFARGRVNDVISYIKERCDLTRTEQCDVIHATGLGGNEFGSQLEVEFGLMVINSNEVDRFVDAFCFLLSSKTSDLFLTPSEEGLQTAECRIQLALNRHKIEGGEAVQYCNPTETKLHSEKLGKKSHFPFIIANCGSACGLNKVTEDRHYSHVDSTLAGGLFFLGLSGVISQVRDYTSLQKLIKDGDGSTADTQYMDIAEDVLCHTTAVSDSVTQLGAGEDLTCRPMEKLLYTDKDAVRVGDVVRSVLQTVSEHIAQVAHYTGRVSGTHQVYFTGSFVSHPLVRNWMTESLVARNRLLPQGEAVGFEFVKHGGHMGALGAFLRPYLQQQVWDCAKENSATMERS